MERFISFEVMRSGVSFVYVYILSKWYPTTHCHRSQLLITNFLIMGFDLCLSIRLDGGQANQG